MSNSIIRPWRSTLWKTGQVKPNGIPRINWNHPLAWGLVSYWFDTGLGFYVDLVTGRTTQATSTGGTTVPAKTVTPWGTGFNFNATLTEQADPAVALNQSWAAPYSCIMGFVSYGNNSGSGPGWFGLVDSTSNDAFCFYAASNTLLAVSYSNGNTPFTFAPVANTFYVIVGSATGASAQSTWINGVAQTAGTSTSTYSGSGMHYSFNPQGSAYNAASSTNCNSSIFFGAAWLGRALTQTEATLLYTDPYCFLLPATPEFQIFSAGINFTPSSTSISLSSTTPTVALSGQTSLSPSSASLSLSSTTPVLAISGNVSLTPASSSISLSGQTPSVTTGAVVPTIVQHVASSANCAGIGITGNNFKFLLPNSIGAGNCIVLGISYPHGSTPTISDNNSNTWPSSPAITADAGTGNYVSSIFVLPDANAGITIFEVSFGSAIIPFQYTISEITNVATVTPVNGTTSNVAVAGASLTSGSFTPGDNHGSGGNLIWNYYAISGAAGGNPTSWVSGGSFSLLDGDIAWTNDQGFPHASQFYVQTTSAAINPGITATGDTADHFNCVAVALKAQASGTPASPFRVAKTFHFSSNDPPSSNWIVQTPTVGNLIVILLETASAISGVSDSDSGTWPSPIIGGNTGTNYTYIYYSVNRTPNLARTITINLGFNNTTSFRIYDIIGAATSPFNASATTGTVSCSSVTAITNAPSITTSNGPGLILACAALSTGPGLAITSPSGAAFDLVTYTGETDSDLMDNADCSAVYFYSTNETYNIDWTITSVSGNYYSSAAAAFLAAPLSYNLSPASASITLTTSSPSIGFSPSPTSLALTSTTPIITQGIVASPASVTLTLSTSTSSIGLGLYPPTASINTTLTTPIFVQNTALSPSRASSLLSATTPSLSLSFYYSPNTGSFVLTPTTPIVALSNNYFITPPTESIALISTSPATSISTILSPPSAVLSLTNLYVTESLDQYITETGDYYGTEGLAPIVTIGFTGINLSPAFVSISLSSTTPTVAVSNARNLVPSSASLTLTSTTPNVALSGNISLIPSASSVLLSTTTPIVSASNSFNLAPSSSSLSLVSTTSSIAHTNNVSLIPASTSILLSNTQPIVTLSNALNLLPATASLNLTPTIPNISQSSNVNFVPTSANVSITANQPITTIGFNLSPSTSSLTILPTIPNVVWKNSFSLIPSAANLALYGNYPLISGNQIFSPTSIPLNLASSIPNSSVGTNLLPSSTSSIFTTTIPNVLQTFNVYATPDSEFLNFIPFVPNVIVSEFIAFKKSNSQMGTKLGSRQELAD